MTSLFAAKPASYRASIARSLFPGPAERKFFAGRLFLDISAVLL
jgi:hypothetical protein